MDMSIGLKVPSGAICTLSLSFNNEGPLGTFFRYICDNGTYIARYDDLFDGDNKPIDVSKVDVSMNGIELQDREFFAAIQEGREPNASVAQCCRPCARSIRSEEFEVGQRNEVGIRPSPCPSPSKLALASLPRGVTASASGCGWRGDA